MLHIGSKEHDVALLTLEERLGYRWWNQMALVRAVTHSSYGNEFGRPFNERDEFLGDAILDLLTAEHLMKALPSEREGGLSIMRSELVRKESMARHARNIGLGDVILVGTKSQAIRAIDSVLADGLEAVVGSAYRDSGSDLPTCRAIAKRIGILL